MKKILITVMLTLGAVFVACALAAHFAIRAGMDTSGKPSALEERIARTARSLAVPESLRDADNPLLSTTAVLREAREHFADHCATCHGNDGKGNTQFGKRMYPPVPDMTLDATQDMSDGELFAAIDGGIRFTGMPAFGTGKDEGKVATWKLVHFIRHLPSITEAELEEMSRLNPRTPDEWERLKEEEEFLSGGGATSATPSSGDDPGSHGSHLH